MTKLEFLKAMKKLTAYYLKDMNEEQITAWYSIFQDKNYLLFVNTIDEIATEQKIFPNVSELLKKYVEIEKKNQYGILELMKKDGYFKTTRELEKAQLFIEKDCVPKWLLSDMEKYNNNTKKIKNEDNKFLTN